jgi:hypothetical protein
MVILLPELQVPAGAPVAAQHIAVREVQEILPQRLQHKVMLEEMAAQLPRIMVLVAEVVPEL